MPVKLDILFNQKNWSKNSKTHLPLINHALMKFTPSTNIMVRLRIGEEVEAADGDTFINGAVQQGWI